ncbi:MAG: rhomboid family intramembrane serine protease, partial [Paracoccaceae bacterium]
MAAFAQEFAMQDMNAAPINPLPLVVWVLVLPIIAMELVLSAAGAGLIGGAEGIGWRLQALERFAFSPDLMRYFLDTGQYPLDGMHRLVSYPFVHGSLTHVVFVVVILLALGKMVGEVFRWWAV